MNGTFLKVLMRMCLLISNFSSCSKSILRSVGEIFESVLEVLEFFSRVKMRYSWIIQSVENALIFKALFPGCQHGVGQRVSLRGAVVGCAELCHVWQISISRHRLIKTRPLPWIWRSIDGKTKKWSIFGMDWHTECLSDEGRVTNAPKLKKKI